MVIYFLTPLQPHLEFIPIPPRHPLLEFLSPIEKNYHPVNDSFHLKGL